MIIMHDSEIRRRVILATLAGTVLFGGGLITQFATAQYSKPPPLALHEVEKQQGFADLVRTVKSAVVNIATTEDVKQTQTTLPESGQFADMLRQFLGPNAQQLLQQNNRPVHALGSGFIIDPAGYIVTNNHVIDDASDIEVTLANGSMHTARIVGRDAKTDLALLKIDSSRPLPYVAFGDSDKEEVGDWVIAVGNPYGLGGSVSAGIVSASNRDIEEGPYDDFLQVDAPINPGDSGGPLFDQSGHVVGIDTAIYSPTGGSVGIGFAIPSNVAVRVVDDLRAHGRVARGWIGIALQRITPALAKAIGFDIGKGALVVTVSPNSPADRAGVRQGDVITAFNGEHVATPRDLAFAVADTAAGKSVGMTLWRGGHEQTVAIAVRAETQKLASAAPAAVSPPAPVGMELAPIPPELGVDGGALVAGVTPGGSADRSGLEAGDVILAIDNRKVASPEEAVQRIRGAEASNRAAVPLLVIRGGATSYVALELGSG